MKNSTAKLAADGSLAGHPSIRLEKGVFDKLPDGALLSVREISHLTGRSRTSVWRDARDGRLASPVRLGRNSVRWRVGDVRRYMGEPGFSQMPEARN